MCNWYDYVILVLVIILTVYVAHMASLVTKSTKQYEKQVDKCIEQVEILVERMKGEK